jgi:hypothetical protein
VGNNVARLTEQAYEGRKRLRGKVIPRAWERRNTGAAVANKDLKFCSDIRRESGSEISSIKEGLRER